MPDLPSPDHHRRREDLRTPALALVAWAAALAGFGLPGWSLLTACALVLGALGWRWWRGGPVVTALVWTVAALGVGGSAVLRHEAVGDSAVAELARDGAAVHARLVVTADPVRRQGRSGEYVVLRARTVEVTGRGVRHRVRSPVVLLADDLRWARVPLGAQVETDGRLRRSTTRDLAGVLSPRGPPEVRSHPGPLLAGADRVRASIRASVADEPEAPRALVPALVDGDDAGLPAEVVEDFRTAGLTHLLAVSGTNLTLVVGSLLLLARWAGVRARGLLVVGALGVVGFVLLARAEPSVVRAAAMGSVALLGMGTDGRRRGTRILGVAVLVLLLVQPWLATSPGFALSVCATAGILWLAPGWRDRLARWLPRWVAEAVTVPLAAQVACTPLVAALSGQVSLVAVGANLLAAPAVGPATVLGLAGGLVGLAWGAAGSVVATPAAWCARWIIAVAERSASLPLAALDWSTGVLGLGVLTVLCVVLALGLGPVLARRSATAAVSGLLLVVVLVPLPSPGWPPRGWVMVACDVGQGDALVLAAGRRTAVVVDAGPDARLVDRCLDRLGVEQVPLVVLTHFHADHVDGLPGVLAGRRVGAVEVTATAEPERGMRLVVDAARRADVPVRTTAYGGTRQVGPLTWQVVAPSGPPSPGSESPPNDASVVLLVQSRGLRLLLMGDEEELSQQRLRRETGGLRADVLKVAHHGSASQDPELVRETGARVAVVSVGEDNDYGHPAPSLLALLRDAGMRVARTDQQGDVAVVADPDLRVVDRGGGGS